MSTTGFCLASAILVRVSVTCVPPVEAHAVAHAVAQITNVASSRAMLRFECIMITRERIAKVLGAIQGPRAYL